MLIVALTCRRLLKEWVNWKSWSETLFWGACYRSVIFLSLFFPQLVSILFTNSYCGFNLVISENCSLFISLMCFFLFTFPHVAVSNMGGCKSYSINKGNIHKRSSAVCTIQILVCRCVCARVFSQNDIIWNCMARFCTLAKLVLSCEILQVRESFSCYITFTGVVLCLDKILKAMSISHLYIDVVHNFSSRN